MAKMTDCKISKGSTRGGVYGSSKGSQMGAPKMGKMQTPARLAKTNRAMSRKG